MSLCGMGFYFMNFQNKAGVFPLIKILLGEAYALNYIMMVRQEYL